MKRNLILTGILALLLFLTWLWQERGEQLKQELSHKQEQVFDPSLGGGLKSIALPNVELFLKDDQFYVGEKQIPADALRVKELFEAFDGLAAIRTLTADETALLDMNLAFVPEESLTIVLKTNDGNETKFVLGSRLPADQGRFYAKLGDKVVILHDRRPLENAYQKENEGELKANRLRAVFSLKADFFYDTQLITSAFEIESVSFDNRYARPYQVFFSEIKTNPPVMTSVGYDENEFLAWKQAAQNLKAKSMQLSFNEKSLSNYRGQVKLQSKSGEVIEWSLFGKYGPMEGDFVITNQNKNLYELGNNDAGLFFQNMQDFWQLTLFHRLRQLKFSDGKDTLAVEFNNENTFSVSVAPKTYEPRTDRLAVFYNMLTERAFYISALEDTLVKNLKDGFVIQSGPRSLDFKENTQEWVIVDRANGLAYHYRKKDFPDLSGKLLHYFGKKI